MSKLNSYCINQALRSIGICNPYMGMTRNGWLKMPFKQYDQLRYTIMCSFEDRFETGYTLNELIEYLEITGKYKFILNFLKTLKEASFENYSVSTVSPSLLCYIFSISTDKIKKQKSNGYEGIGMFTNRYGVKKFIKFRKEFQHWLDEEQQYLEFQADCLVGYNRG